MPKKNLYEFNCYDQNLNLKVPFGLKFSILFSIKEFILIFLAFNPSKRISSGLSYLADFVSLEYLLLNIPALLLIFTWWNRAPDAKPIWRKIWKKGRFILLFVYLSTLLLTLYDYYNLRHINNEILLTFLTIIGVQLFVIIYLFRFPIVKDVFDDFPTEDENVS